MTETMADPKRWKALAVLGIAYLMVVLDVSIVNVALPSIQSDLGFSTEDLQWVVSGYALTFGGFLLLGGRMGDLLGRRKLFMVGLGLFLVTSLLAGLSTSSEMLMTRFMWCSTRSTVSSKSSRICLMNSPRADTSSWLRPPAGSSSSSRRGFATRARASSTRFWIPYGRAAAGNSGNEKRRSP